MTVREKKTFHNKFADLDFLSQLPSSERFSGIFVVVGIVFNAISFIWAFEQRKSAPGKPVLEHCVGTQHQISRAPLRFPSARRSHSTLTSDWHASDVWKGAKAHRACSRQIEERRLETHRFKSYN